MTRIHDFIGLVMTGILSLLWFDLRKLRDLKLQDEVNELKKEAEHKEFLYQTFITNKNHDQKCANTLQCVENSIKSMKLEILKEIKCSKENKQ